MRGLVLALFLIAGTAPVWAQLYSYRNKEGKLVITDRPIDSKEYKLVDTYIPKRVREQREEQAEALAQGSRRSASKYVLTKSQIRGLVHPIARSMGVDPELVAAVIEIESGRDARAKSHKGAMGLMQLMPDTAKRFGVKNPWDPRQNVKGGITYLRYLLSYFEGNVDYVLAAYNAGENAIDRHQGVPPYRETKGYLKKIRKIYQTKELSFNKNAAKGRSSLVQNAKTKKSPTQVASAE